MTTIEIDGKEITTQQGTMLIEAADNAGIFIPRFCYHKKLSIAANCRMCLVEVEKMGKPQPACATPVSDGMKVYTRSKKAVDAQKDVMEYLLINHPLDCPICDQGGECELQDLAMGYGGDRSRFTEGKRSVHDEDLGPLIASDMTRCIQCTRCVRFGQEVAGLRELGVVDRGEKEAIKTYVKKSLASELSGNIIDLCPVGALTSKPFRFKARAWELMQKKTIAPHDCLGSHLSVHTRRGKVMRLVPRDNEAINETWASDRDRFSYTGLMHEDRLQNPMIKRGGEWQAVDWEEAFSFIATNLQSIIKTSGPKQIGGVIAPTATLEEAFLFQQLLRSLDCPNVDHRLQMADFSHQETLPLFPDLGGSIQSMEESDSILLIGSNVQREQPLLGHRIRKASLNDARVSCVNPRDFAFNFNLSTKIISHPSDLVLHLAGIAKCLLTETKDATFDPVQPSEAETQIAKQLSEGKQSVILLGAYALNHPQAATLYALATLISKHSGARLGVLTAGPNAAGHWLAGTIPHRQAVGEATKQGLDCQAMWRANLQSYFLFNVEPELDCANPASANAALAQAKFVVACTPFRSEGLLATAHVLLPMAAFTETDGTYVNVEGIWQSFTAAVSPFEKSKPGWALLCELGNVLNLPDFNYPRADAVRDVLRERYENATFEAPSPLLQTEALAKKTTTKTLTRVADWPLYAVDPLVRRSLELQASAASAPVGVYVNEETASQLGVSEEQFARVSQGQTAVKLRVYLDNGVPNHCVAVSHGYIETASLGESFGPIEVTPYV